MLRKSTLKSKSAPFILFIILFLPTLGAETNTDTEIILKNAYKAEKAGYANKAFKYYIKWLENVKNPEEKLYYNVLNSILKNSSDIGQAISIIERFSSKNLSIKHRIKLLNAAATLSELMGNFIQAKKLYKISWKIDPSKTNLNSLVNYLATLYTTGNFKNVIDTFKKMQPTLNAISSKDEEGKCYLIRGFSYLQIGNYKLAEKDFKRILNDKDFINQQQAAKLGMYYALKGQNKKATDPHLFLSKRIKLFPSPNAYFLSSIGQENVKETTKVTEPVINYETLNKGFYIQIGAFSLEENALYLYKSLTAKGFSPQITKIHIHEKIFFRVIIGPYNSIKESQITVNKLKKAGFNGIIKRVN